MPIRPIPIHAPNFEVLRAHVPDVDPNDHARHRPHRVYDVDLEALRSGKGGRSLRLVAWRYIFRGTDQHLHVAEVGVHEASGSHAFHLINKGRHVDEFVALCSKIDQDEKVQKNDYEITLVRAPACYVMAVGFKPIEHKRPFFVPLAPVHSAFQAGKHYELEEFMELLREVAEKMAGSSPAPRV